MMNEEAKYTILYVDDEESNLRIFKNTFRKEYNILTASSGQEGLKLLEEGKVDLILTDQRMPGMSGVDFLKKAIDKYPELNRILVTAYSDYEILREAVNELRIFQYVEKPWREEDIKSTIDSALEIHRLKMENLKLTMHLQKTNKDLSAMNESLKSEIEKHKRTQAELIREKEYAEQCNRLKSAFLANMSHEIRTPMNSIIGFSNLIIGTETDAAMLRRYLQIIEKSSWQLLNIVSDIIEISIIDTGNLEIKSQPFDILPIAENAVLAYQTDAKNKSIDLSFESSLPYGKSWVMGDPARISKVFSHLLSNAIKFTPEGSVVVRAGIQGDSALFSVEDTGIGIGSEYLPYIFDRFYQVESAYTRKQGGNGLGLAIVKAFVEKMGGEIWVESVPEKGSAFKFILPFAKQ